MQGLSLIFFSALLTLICAQGADKGGCCFYNSTNFEGEIVCTSQTFRLSDFASGKSGIKSFYCTQLFSAAILDDKEQIMEEASCGDDVGETTDAIMATSVSVGECLERRCCFYTGKNKDGNEFCMFADSAAPEDLKEAQKDSKFAVGDCTADWAATLHSGGKPTLLDCGVTLDLPSLTYDKITLRKCETPRSRIQGEAFDEAFFQDNNEFVDAAFSDAAFADMDTSEDNVQADQAVFDDFQDQAGFDDVQADQAVFDNVQADQAVFDNVQADQAVFDDFQADQVLGSDSFSSEFDGEVLTDSFDAATDDFDQVFAFDQQAVEMSHESDEAYVDYATDAQGNSYSSGSAIFGSILTIVVVSAVFL